VHASEAERVRRVRSARTTFNSATTYGIDSCKYLTQKVSVHGYL
jgi:hypothetical protein